MWTGPEAMQAVLSLVPWRWDGQGRDLAWTGGCPVLQEAVAQRESLSVLGLSMGEVLRRL